MRLTAFFFLFGAVRSLQSQVAQVTQRSDVALPACVEQCIRSVPTISVNESASTADLDSNFCSDITSLKALSGCVQNKCTYSDSTTAFRFQSELCKHHKGSSRSTLIRYLSIALTATAALFFLVRIYSRISVMRHFWWDDGTVFAATIFLCTMTACMIYASMIGLGQHSWEVSPKNMIINNEIFFGLKLLYIWTQVLLKISTLQCYLRILSFDRVRKVTWLLIFFMLAHGVAFSIAIVLQCTPVSRVWNTTSYGKCIDLKHILLPAAMFSVSEDIAILVLPIRHVVKLHIGKCQRTSLIAMFSIGFIATLISVARIRAVWVYKDTLDQTWDSVNLLVWNQAEVTTAYICVCLPSLKAILNKHFPKQFGSAALYLDNHREQRSLEDHYQGLTGMSERKPNSPRSQRLARALSPFGKVELGLQRPAPIKYRDGVFEHQGVIEVRTIEIYLDNREPTNDAQEWPLSPSQIERMVQAPQPTYLKLGKSEPYTNLRVINP